MFLELRLLLFFCIPFIEWYLIVMGKVVLISPQRVIVIVVRKLSCLERIKTETLLPYYLSKSN